MARLLRLESEGRIYHVLNRGNYRSDLATSGKSADWKIAIAAALKARTTVTNRWLATTLHLGNLYEVSRKVAVWMRNPEPTLAKKLQITPSPDPVLDSRRRHSSLGYLSPVEFEKQHKLNDIKAA